MEENANPVLNAPVNGGEGNVEVRGGGGGEGLGEVNDVSNVKKRKRNRPKKLPDEAQQSDTFIFSAPQMVLPSPTPTQPPFQSRYGWPPGSGQAQFGGATFSHSPGLSLFSHCSCSLPDEAQQSAMFISSAPQIGFPIPISTQSPFQSRRGWPQGSSRDPFGGATFSHSTGFRDREIIGYGKKMKVHVLSICPGDDVHSKIVLFAQSRKGTTTSVVSCTGSVSRICTCSLGSPRDMIYEGLFEILTLNGTFTNVRLEDSYQIKGTLAVSFAKPNGKVFGGRVSGPIVAASPIQVLLESFELMRSPSQTNIQFQSYDAPHLATPLPPTFTAPPTATVALPIPKPNVSFRQASQVRDSLPLSKRLDPLTTSNTPVVTSIASNPEDDQLTSYQLDLNQSQEDTEALDENPVTNTKNLDRYNK